MLSRNLLSTSVKQRPMWRAGAAGFLAALAWLGAIALAQRGVAAEEAPAADEGDALHLRWPEYREAELTSEGAASPWCDLIVPAEVFGRAREDLGDLRLFDASGRTAPYALRTLESAFSQQELQAGEFNRATVGKDTSELTLDLGEAPAEHNEVELQLPGEDFRRPVLLEGSDDAIQWRKLAERSVFYFRSGDRELHELSLAYPPSRFRYLRVRVERDATVDEMPVEIEAAIVRRRVELPGEFLSLEVAAEPREAVRAAGEPGSAWIFDFGVDRLPCERLEVEILEEQFARDYVIEAGGPAGSDQPFVEVTRGQWSRKEGERSKLLSAAFPEQRCARLRLVVTDYSNPPLTVLRGRVSGAARQLVFQRGDSLRGPLRLYYGDLKAEPPHYDLERNLPARLDPPPQRLTLGPPQPNPDYVPEPKPFTERWPWLVDSVLAAAGLTLAAIIVSLGRTAIARADARDEMQSASAAENRSHEAPV